MTEQWFVYQCPHCGDDNVVQLDEETVCESCHQEFAVERRPR